MDTSELLELFSRFGMALALGLLIGVEREREKARAFAGIRTFPLITVAGCLAAMLDDYFVDWLFVAGLIAVTAIVIRALTATQHGTTTQISSLLAYLLGGMVWWGYGAFAAAIAVVIVMLLSAKEPMENLAKQIGHKDIVAIVQFGVITLIILPILPNKTYGPLDVLNPYKIWLMVVLISAIDLVGYAVSKIIRARRGIELVGAVGGLVSSTAVALGLSKKSRSSRGNPESFAIGILLASCIMFPRVLFISFTINSKVAALLGYPILAATCAGIIGCAFLWRSQAKKNQESETAEVESKNPLELWSAVKFGLLFGIILFVAKAAMVYTGDAGVYLSSIVAGLTDVDAITLSLSDLASSSLEPAIAARGIVLATASNTLVKASIIMMLAAPGVRKRALPVFFLIGAAAVASAFVMG